MPTDPSKLKEEQKTAEQAQAAEHAEMARAVAPIVEATANKVLEGVLPAIEGMADRVYQRRVEDITKQVMESESRRLGRSIDDLRNDPEFKKNVIEPALHGPFGVTQVARAHDFAPIGRAIIEDDGFNAWKARGFKGDSPLIDIDLRKTPMGRTAGVTGTGVTDMNTVLATLYQQQIVPLPLRQLHLRDLLTVIPTSQSAVTFVQQTGYTNAAAAIQRTNSDPALAIRAPQGAIAVAPVTKSVVSIETVLPYPRVSLEDIPQTMAWLESQMNDGTLDAEDGEIVSGSGASPHMEGFLTNASVQSYAWSSGLADDNQADAILRGIVQAYIAKYATDGIIMNPNDWALIFTLKDAQKRYIIDQVMQQGAVPTLWGQPIALTAYMTQHTVLTGGFRRAAKYYERQAARVQFLDQHSDWATKGLVAVYGTARGVLVLERPENFVKVDISSGPS